MFNETLGESDNLIVREETRTLRCLRQRSSASAKIQLVLPGGRSLSGHARLSHEPLSSPFR